jgi:hypothetical protein
MDHFSEIGCCSEASQGVTGIREPEGQGVCWTGIENSQKEIL